MYRARKAFSAKEGGQKVTALNRVPTHVWLLICVLTLLVAYYIRPDPVTVNLLQGFASALLLSLNPNKQQPPPNP